MTHSYADTCLRHIPPPWCFRDFRFLFTTFVVLYNKSVNTWSNLARILEETASLLCVNHCTNSTDDVASLFRSQCSSPFSYNVSLEIKICRLFNCIRHPGILWEWVDYRLLYAKQWHPLLQYQIAKYGSKNWRDESMLHALRGLLAKIRRVWI